MNKITILTETALANLLIANLDPSLGLNIQTGVDDATIALPVAICFAESALESVYGTQIFKVNAGVQLQSLKSDGANAHRNRIAAIESILFNADQQSGEYKELAFNLTAATGNYFVHGVVVGRIQHSIDSDKWLYSIPLEITCEWFNLGISSSSSSSIG